MMRNHTGLSVFLSLFDWNCLKDPLPSRFLKDFFTSLIELSWWWTIFWFSASFFLSWLLFGVVWFLVAIVHGDLDPEYLAAHPDHVVCVDNIEDFTTAFLFSVETQHTIGYGGRATSNQCAFAIIVMCIQSIVGVIISVEQHCDN